MGASFDHSRRVFLGIAARDPSPEESHISSLLVLVRPEQRADIATRISRLAGAELQPSPMPGKLIVTLETETTRDIMERLEAIHEMPGVVSAALVYHHWEFVREGGTTTADSGSE